MSYDEVKNEIFSEQSEQDKGSRYFAREFKKLYGLRAALVKIEKARHPKYEGGKRDKNGKVTRGTLVAPAKLSNEEAYNLAVEVIQEALEN